MITRRRALLTSGAVRVLITPSPDREVILADINAGGYFGEMAAIDGQPRSAGILAITDATIACMSASVFREILHKHPDVSEHLLKHLVARIRMLDQRISCKGFMASDGNEYCLNPACAV